MNGVDLGNGVVQSQCLLGWKITDGGLLFVAKLADGVSVQPSSAACLYPPLSTTDNEGTLETAC